MSKSRSNNQKPTSDRVYETKQRKCLMCQDPFTSEWPGERVCQRCKSTGAWRAA